MLRTVLLTTGILLTIPLAFAQDDYLLELDAEANRAPETTTRTPQQATRQQPENSGTETTNLNGFKEILQYQAPGSYELFKRLRADQKQDILALYNLGTDLKDILPEIADLFKKSH